MASTASSIDLSARPARPVLALVLALLSVPGSMLTWDTLPGGGFLWGFPLAVAAIVLGVQARQRTETGRSKALAAILIGGAMVAIMIVWTIVASL
jgi:biotin transporter BioY